MIEFKGAIPLRLKQGTIFAFFCCSWRNPRDNCTAIYKTHGRTYSWRVCNNFIKKTKRNAYIWREENQERIQVSCHIICIFVGSVHTAADAELVVWGYEVYSAQQTQTGSPHRESRSVPASCLPAKKGSPRRRKPLTTNLARVNKYCTGTSVRVARVYFFSSCCCCTT